MVCKCIPFIKVEMWRCGKLGEGSDIHAVQYMEKAAASNMV